MMRDWLERGDEYRVLVTHFGDLVKYICEKFFDWDGVKDENGRSLLQYVGTNKVRKSSPDYWVNFIASMLTFFDEEWDYVILGDARYPNEIEVLRSYGFDVSHVRVVYPGVESALTKEQQAHSSETALDSVVPDYEIVNEGSFAQLSIKVLYVLADIMAAQNDIKTEYRVSEGEVVL